MDIGARGLTAVELRLAARVFRKQPIVSAAMLLALTVGIGIATTGFTLLDAVLFSRLPYPNGDRFVLLETFTEPGGQRASVESERRRYLAAHATTLEHLGAARGAEVTLTLPSGEFAPATGVSITSSSIAVFPYAPVVGRTLRADDGLPGAEPVVLLRESLWRRHFSADANFVRKFFGGANPIGGRLRTLRADPQQPEEPWREIVGVVPDLGLSAGDSTMAAGYYVPMPGREAFHIALRTTGDARQLAGPLRDAVSRLDPTIQLRDVVLLQEVGREDRAVFAGIAGALGALGVMALLLSVIGTYAILSLSVSQRTREIGIRVALGASRGRILMTVVGGTAIAPALGAAAGLVLGQVLVAARGIFAFRVPDSAGPWGLPALAAVMIAAVLLAAWVPARRALSVAPADALRAE
jgi:hypothetical protein